MAAALPFDFQEVLSRPMIDRLPRPLVVSGAGDSEVLLIVRLLSGALSIKHAYSGRVINQKNNFFSSDLKGFRSGWDRKFPAIIGENVNAEDFSKYIVNSKFKNRAFFRNVLLELCNFSLHSARGSHTSAFIYIYRTLENISYSFPLIYVSRTDDFTKTFGFLKDLMTENKDSKDKKEKGELGFYKAFVLSLYKDDPISESSIDFHISIGDEDIQKQIFNSLFEVTQGQMQAGATEYPRRLSIKFCEIGSFIVVIRNRFFHYMNGGAKNFESKNIVDSDLLFSLINSQCMHWISTIFLGILSHHLAEDQARGIASH